MAAIDILRLFRRVQPQEDKRYITHREFVEAQLRLEQSIEALNRFCRTVVPTGTIVYADLTAEQVAGFFDGSGLGRLGGPWEGWGIANGENGRPALDGRFLRSNTDGAGETGGSDSNAHTHSIPAHSHSGSGLYADIVGTSATDLVIREINGQAFTPTAKYTVSGGTSYSTPTSYSTGIHGSTATDGSGTSGAASATENRPAFYEAVPLVRL